MLNVNQITSYLAKLQPDAALQRYAMMHKDDPYVLSLAVAESNRRKQTRMGAQINAPQQPKVAEQAIQSMAAPMPETVGIGQLPAGNMDFAEGGIVAFDEGGEVPRYNGRDGSQVVYPGMLPTEGRPLLPATTGYEGLGMIEFLRQAGGDVAGRLKKLIRSEEENAARMYGGRTADMYEARRERGPDPFGYDPAQYPMPVGTAGTASVAAPVAGAGQTPPPAPTGTPQLRAPGGAPTQGFDSSPAGLMAAYDSIQKKSQGQLADPLTAQREEVSMADIAAQQKAIDAFKRDKEAQGEFGEAEEGRLKKRGERIEASEKQNLGLALLQAGSAMMAGKSKYALANIGAGVGVGAEQFARGLEKIDMAKDRLDDAFSRLEQARRMENRLDAAELRKLEGELAASFRREKERGLEGLQMALGLSEKRATAVFDAYAKDRLVEKEISARRDIAGMLPGEARTAIFLGEGKTDQERYMSGVKRIQEATADRTGMAAIKLLAETNAKREAAMLPPVTMEELVASAREYSALMFPKTTSSVPGGAPVLKQP